MSLLKCPKCRNQIDVPPELLSDNFDCFQCQTPFQSIDPPGMAAARAQAARSAIGAGDGQLAGLVLALIGIVTYATTSPFGFVLSLEKVIWRHPTRPFWTRLMDWIGLIVGGIGTLYVPFFGIAMWNYSLIGPTPVLIYSISFIIWLWYRVRVVWRWPT